MEKLSKLDEVVNIIKESKEYKNCIDLKNKMDSNEEIKLLVNKIKRLQKKYIRSSYDTSIKKELEEVEKELKEIPIYNIYLENLEKVNEMIDYVKDSLNDYFYELLN